MIRLGHMADLSEYLTIKEAAAHQDVPYSEHWLRKLAESGAVHAKKIGEGIRGRWLVHLPSLLKYVQQMNELGSQKHDPLGRRPEK